MKEQFHVYGIGMNGASYPLPFALEDFGNVLRFSITKRMLENTNLNTVVVETELLKAQTGEEVSITISAPYSSSVRALSFSKVG